MEKTYTDYARILKALGEPTRLQIMDMISCGELCACIIQEKFNITQPTLSHHMKVLCDAGLAVARKEGKWTHYAVNKEAVHELGGFIEMLAVTDKKCVCNE